MSTVQINPFRPSLSHSTTDSKSFQFGVEISSQPAFAVWPPQNFFYRGLNPLSAALINTATGIDLSKCPTEFGTYSQNLHTHSQLNCCTASNYVTCFAALSRMGTTLMWDCVPQSGQQLLYSDYCPSSAALSYTFEDSLSIVTLNTYMP